MPVSVFFAQVALVQRLMCGRLAGQIGSVRFDETVPVPLRFNLFFSASA